MCGISGFVGGERVDDDGRVATAMADALGHRGPDGRGVVALRSPDGPVGWFGHRRLRVLDLTEAAAQPLAGEGGAALLSYNGEIYNYVELRRTLEREGVAVRSTGDTAVLLAGYERWGADVVTRLEGMFAFALWDAAEGRLLLARDRTGKKPLFHAVRDGRLTFASEVKALARAPWIALEPDPAAFPELLTAGAVAAPRTAYRGIHQLPPGCTATFRPGDDAPRIVPYWTGRVGRRRPLDADVLALVRQRFDEAVERRMRSDVPLGALLSGGIDSSLVVAHMVRRSAGTVRTFSAGLVGAGGYDERPWARRVADALGTDHTDFAVQPDAVALLDRLVWLHDGPFADSSAIPTYLVCEAARRKVTVVLTGDGGDEAFAGYQRFAAAALSRAVPPSAAGLAARVARLLPSTGGYADPARRLARFAADAEQPLDQRYLGWVSVFPPAGVARLTGGGGRAGQEPFLRALSEVPDLPPVDRLVHANLRTYLPDDLHVKVDRTAMAHGLEARSPFLDTALLELALAIPARDKVGFRTVKPVLRRAFGPMLPAAVWRRPKHGFGVPMDRWFDGELGELYADEVLGRDGRLGGVLDPGELRRLHADHAAGRARRGPQLWTLLTMERWLRDLARPQPLREPSAAVATTDVR